MKFFGYFCCKQYKKMITLLYINIHYGENFDVMVGKNKQKGT